MISYISGNVNFAGDRLQILFEIWTEYRKIQTRNNYVFGHFSRSVRDPDVF